jgi:hypothetical protein
MKQKWLGLVCVVAIALGVVVAKHMKSRDAVQNESTRPSVLLVADLREADSINDGCADIIRAARDTARRGIPVAELMPDSSSDLLRRYKVLVAPTVLILDRDGREVARFEGEDPKTVEAIRTELAQLKTGER